jgi:outer membrane protein assembly factor BamB
MNAGRIASTFCIVLSLVLLTVGCSPPPSPRENGDGDSSTSPQPAETDDATDTAPADPATDSGEDAATTPTDDQPDPDDAAASAVEPAPESADAPAAAERVVSGDWPMWGGSIDRNMVNETTGISIDFVPRADPQEGIEVKKVLWTAKLGSQTYGNPVVAGGKVFVGTNNGAEYRPQHKRVVENEREIDDGDRGCVLAFDEKTGEFLWQLTRKKLPQGRVNDWPEQGICSTCAVEGDRMWVVTNRAELMCLDTEGFHDGENDGPFTEEEDNEKLDADIVWSYDMIEEMGVFPHNLATSSPVVYGDLVFILTSNGVDEAHLEIPSPRSPSFLAVKKTTGEIAWEDNTPLDQILHGQWGSPAVGVVGGKAQVYFPGGDGWVYALDAESGEHIWKFDLNPKDSKWELGGYGTRNSLIATPVFYKNSVLLAVGQDPEHGEGVGHLYRIDATKTGDVSPVTPDNKPNPNSAQIWHYGGTDEDGSVTGNEGDDIFRRTLSTVAVHDGLVYLPDLSGFFHCVDVETGKRQWMGDLFAAVWGSAMVADGKVFIGDEDGELAIFSTGREEKELATIEFNSSIYSTPTIANGVIFITDRSRLYAIDAF